MEIGDELATQNLIPLYKILDEIRIEKKSKKGMQGYSNTYFSFFTGSKT